VIFVSHDLAAVNQLCSKGVVLKQGAIEYIGETEISVRKYLEQQASSTNFINESDFNDNDYFVRSITLLNEQLVSQSTFSVNEKIIAKFNINLPDIKSKYSIFINLKTNIGNKVFAIEKPLTKSIQFLEISKNFLTRGSYTFDIFIHIPRQFQVFKLNNVCLFEVVDIDSELSVHGEYDYGVVFGNYEWK